MPTELADGLRLEGVFLREIRPKNWFLRLNPFNDHRIIQRIELGYPHSANANLILIISQLRRFLEKYLNHGFAGIPFKVEIASD